MMLMMTTAMMPIYDDAADADGDDMARVSPGRICVGKSHRGANKIGGEGLYKCEVS